MQLKVDLANIATQLSCDRLELDVSRSVKSH